MTPDGRYLIFSRVLTSAHREILQVPFEGDAEPVPLLQQGEVDRGNAEPSPNGDWFAYRSDQSGQMEVYVRSYPEPGPRFPVSVGGGTSVTWSPDGSELFYRRLDGRMMAASFSEQGGRPVIGRPVELFGGPYLAALPNAPREYHVAPDGRFLMIKQTTGTSEEPQVVLVQNFFEELKRLVPPN